MRSRLPILMWLAAFATASLLASADESAGDSAGNRLVAEAAQSLMEQPAFEAKVRQWATMFGQRVSGAGFYLQLREADRLLLRYEFKLQVGEQRTSLLQVNDGTKLWLRHDYGQLQSQASVYIRTLREAKQRMQGTDILPHMSPELALGGLSEILLNIERNFRFDDPQPAELKGIPTWELTGKWKPERLAQLAPAAVPRGKSVTAIDGSALPSQLPDVVKIFLGNDEKFPLFPYRVAFGRTRRSDSVASIGSSQPPSVDPLLTIELYEPCRRPDLTPTDFSFQPSDENVEDRTDVYLRKLGLVKEE